MIEVAQQAQPPQIGTDTEATPQTDIKTAAEGQSEAEIGRREWAKKPSGGIRHTANTTRRR